jgi:hypothetical protein
VLAAFTLALAAATGFLRDATAATIDAVAYHITVAHNGAQVDSSLAPPFVRRWQIALPGLVSYPLVAEGLVFVTAGGNDTGPDSTLYALDQATGDIVWSRQLAQPPPVVYPWANAAYDGGRVFAVGTAGLLAAYDARTGEPLAGQGLLIVPAGNTVSAFAGRATPAVRSTPVPTISEWPLVVLAGLLLVAGAASMRRSDRQQEDFVTRRACEPAGAGPPGLWQPAGGDQPGRPNADFACSATSRRSAFKRVSTTEAW